MSVTLRKYERVIRSLLAFADRKYLNSKQRKAFEVEVGREPI